MKDNEYKCAMCGGVFEKGWTDEEANAEMKGFFGQSMQASECAVICDDCFQKIHPDTHPREVEEAVAEHAEARKPRRMTDLEVLRYFPD